LKDYPIRLGFVRELHRVLMNSVRGQDKTPGDFRLEQNWIGRHGCTMEQASFVPPNPMQLPDHLQAWERYLDSDDVDFLLQPRSCMPSLSCCTRLRMAMAALAAF